ncbi:MAG: heptaprenyl diphosphate synthase [Peptococcaceae bacterium]|nr:heptaprenyl diphosphate synthase [Peptococcaceae bacterium]
MKHQKLFKEITSDLKKVEKELDKILKVGDPILSQTCIYLLQAGGKRMRPGFTLLSGKFFDYNFEKILPVAMALEIIHMATLVHDDVVDASLTRRGRPTLAAGWGNTVSIATGDYLFAKALELIVKIDDTEISSILANVCVEMCQGEIQQIKFSFDVQQNYKQYYYRIQRKTALLIGLCCKLGAMVSNANKRQVWVLHNYGHCLGIAFQIVDDILDISADPKILGKPVGGDIRQGIITLPMIYALNDSPNSERLKELIGKETKSEIEIEEAVFLIKQSGGIEKSRHIVDLYVDKAIKSLSELPDIPSREALVELAKFVGERSY